MDKAPIHMLYGEAADGAVPFTLHCETISARSSRHRFEIGIHRHRAFLQFLFIERGTGDAVLEGETLRMQPGSLVTLPPMGAHGFRFSPDVEGLVITLDAGSSACRDILTGALSLWYDRPRLQVLADGPEGQRLRALLAAIAQEFAGRLPGRAELLESLARAALVLSARSGLQQENAGSESMRLSGLGGDRRVAQFFDLVESHFRSQQKAQFYAEALGLSVTHLNRLLRQHHGLSIHEIVLRRQIDHACRDLVFTEIPVQNIGQELGFADPAYFSRLFQRRTGMTPRQYRQEERRKRSF